MDTGPSSRDKESTGTSPADEAGTAAPFGVLAVVVPLGALGARVSR